MPYLPLFARKLNVTGKCRKASLTRQALLFCAAIGGWTLALYSGYTAYKLGSWRRRLMTRKWGRLQVQILFCTWSSNILKNDMPWHTLGLLPQRWFSVLCSISFKRLLRSRTVLRKDSLEQKCHGWFRLVKCFRRNPAHEIMFLLYGTGWSCDSSKLLIGVSDFRDGKFRGNSRRLCLISGFCM